MGKVNSSTGSPLLSPERGRGVGNGDLSTKLTAGAILILMFSLMLFSARQDSAIMDELAHIPAGFGYVTRHDYRLNPEHPPLLKALAAFSAQLFVRPYFPTDTTFWQKDVNGQWNQGSQFLYSSGNDADRIIFWSRFPLILLTVFLAGLIFWWTKKRFGSLTALLTLIFFAFSPTVLAHGRLVTTDIGASFGFFIGIASFLRFVEKPNRRNIIWAGLGTGLAQLLKFSLVLLVPMYAVILMIWAYVIPRLGTKERWLTLFKLGLKTILVGAIGLVLVWAVYYGFTYHEPREKQLSDAEFILASHPSRAAVNFDLTLIKNDFTRPLGQYILGVLMVGQRAGGGNTGYFQGEVSASGWRSYFPFLYLYKEPLALHILTVVALFLAVYKFLKSEGRKEREKILERIRGWIYTHLPEFAAFVLIGVYWASSLASPLNIGVRHVLPTFFFVYLLVARQIAEWLKLKFTFNLLNIPGFLKKYLFFYFKSTLIAALLVWLIAGTLVSFPNFLSYYNELGGGQKNGYKIAVDSNYDWGQDLLRLKNFVENPPGGERIEKIHVDYFGGGSPAYYLRDRFIPWNSGKGYVSGWYAVSATFRTQSFGRPVKGLVLPESETYAWLKSYEPVAKAGDSIFIYHLP